MNIPVFHDDQHGTAIISGAALLNALEVAGKKIADVRSSSPAPARRPSHCCEHYIKLGVRRRTSPVRPGTA
jgi:malate dehydrogenase (oxaloacetate-decarboxylating)(NADP+)